MTTVTMPKHIHPGVQLSPLEWRLKVWGQQHSLSLTTSLPILVFCSILRIWNVAGMPGAYNDDEGTYVSQAWAVLHDGQLAHYTYWYDHPPFGWIQVAGWAWLTHGFEHSSAAIIVGRQLVTIYAVIGGGLMYMLCRRLGMLRVFSVVAMVLFMLNPITQSYGRMVYLDTIAVPWILAALLCATHSKRSHAAALWAGFFLAGAALTKETTLVFAPVVIWIIWRESARSMRLKNLVMSVALTFGLGLFYIGMATLKGELIPGKGHVSLGSSLAWQLGGRGSSGSILNTSSLSHQWFMRWLELDWYLLAASLPMLFVILFRRQLWPIALAAIIHIGLLVRDGYLPIPFIVMVMPIAALLVAGGLDTLWRGWKRSAIVSIVFRGVTVALVLAFAITATPHWYQSTATNMTGDDMLGERQAVNWITNHVATTGHRQIIVDDNIWPDLIARGYDRKSVDWLYKPDTDPAITPRYIPTGGTIKDAWKNVDYVAIPPLPQTIIDSLPILKVVMEHATVVADFQQAGGGSYTIYRVTHPAAPKTAATVRHNPRSNNVR